MVAAPELGAIPAAAATTVFALAIFASTERTVLVDPQGLSVPYWPWKLRQIAPLLIGIGGVWWLWSATRLAPWIRGLSLSVLAAVVLANAEGGLFGEHWGQRLAHG